VAINLITLLAIPFAGGILSYLAEKLRPDSGRIVALITSVILMAASIGLWLQRPLEATEWYARVSLPWIASYGVNFTLGLDGLSLLLVLLTAFLGVIAVGVSWKQISEKSGGYYFSLLWIIGGILGVFLALDLFLFYFFWEMMLVPMYFLIGIWGHENRVYAAIKFFLFTFISGLFLFAAILGLYWLHGEATGNFTFDYFELLKTPLTTVQQGWLMAGFFVAFAVKLPMFGLHTWLPDAHTEAPTAGSVILAGLLLKTGAYGLIRFAVPLFPEAAVAGSFFAAVLGVIAIFYGAVLAFGQSDLKKLVAYSSISHMGFVLIAIAVGNQTAGQGAVLQMVCHGLSAGALFALVGMIDERFHTRDIGQLGGLWKKMPRLSGFVLFFALASLGLPGLGNFIAELLSLLGTFQVWPSLAVLGAIGLVFAAVYSLKIVQGSVHGELKLATANDLDKREWGILLSFAIILLWLGFAPGLVLQETEQLWEQPIIIGELRK